MKNIINVALYGGAFDPPHLGHLSIINELQSIEFIQEVWLLPSGDRDDKKLILPMHQRFQLMEKMFCSKNHKVKIVDEEIKLSKKMNQMIQTSDLIEMMKGLHPGHVFHFVVGSDILDTIHTWGKYKQLLNNVPFIIFPRKGYSLIGPNMPRKYFLSTFQPINISSSEIKKTLLDEHLTKEIKRQKIKNSIDLTTIETLQKNDFI